MHYGSCQRAGRARPGRRRHREGARFGAERRLMNAVARRRAGERLQSGPQLSFPDFGMSICPRGICTAPLPWTPATWTRSTTGSRSVTAAGIGEDRLGPLFRSCEPGRHDALQDRAMSRSSAPKMIKRRARKAGLPAEIERPQLPRHRDHRVSAKRRRPRGRGTDRWTRVDPHRPALQSPAGRNLARRDRAHPYLIGDGRDRARFIPGGGRTGSRLRARSARTGRSRVRRAPCAAGGYGRRRCAPRCRRCGPRPDREAGRG